ncbi:hypothetical protein EDD27_0953 [Nonomuraea polychroma]|uniref:Copper(I)-binding protein n=1 Tax=Nonomuraea polychroma TaxID=46176 RepID=A0A438LYZ7_9ACTN|nr:hypothetical protein [Nonomuraea polychroma]RVX38631.1 hypothetical protein EDD27_0953 [Nonomuraea polychroma]
MRPIASAVIVAALAAAAGCQGHAGFDYSSTNIPQNQGANVDVGKTLHLRNVFLLGGADPASPAPQQALYAVLINDSNRPAKLERITIEGGGSAQLPGPVTVPPNQPVGTGEKPLCTVTGVRPRGTTVPMTFFFSGAEPVRVNVPIKEQTGVYTELTPTPTGSPTPTAPATAPPTGTASPSPTPTPS